MSTQIRTLSSVLVITLINLLAGHATAAPRGIEPPGAGPTAVAPVINSVNPPSGTTSGGYLVTLAGVNLGTSGTLQFGGQFLTAPQITAWTNSAITFFAPTGQGGFVPIVVTPTGSTPATNFFSYSTPVLQNLTYTSAPTSGGVSVVVTGQHLGTSATIFVGSQQATGVIAAHTLLVFTLPAGMGANQQVSAFVGGQISNALTLSYDAPVISPSSVAVAYNGTMTINGQNLGTSGALVSFNNTNCTNVVHTIPHTQITCTVPAGNGTNVPLSVTVGGQTSAIATRNYERPTINSISQQTGPTSGGTIVTIAGTNFGPSNVSVTIGNVTAPVTSTSMTSIVCSTPAGTGPQPVVVTSAGQTSTSAVNFSYASPSISSVTPIPASAGQTITIVGQNFGASGAEVRIAGVLCTSITQTPSTAHTTITCVVPTGSGVGQLLTVKNANDPTMANFWFHYPPPTITSLSSALVGGQTITINGTNFGGSGATVTVGGVAFTNVVHTIPNTRLTATCPFGSGANLPVVVTAGSQNSTPFTASYAAPTVSSIVPSHGPTEGAFTAIVNGSNFGTTTGTVLIGGATATVLTWSNTSAMVSVPAGVGFDLPVRVNAQGILSATSILFDYDPPEICPLTEAIAAGETLTLTGKNFGASGAQVTIGGVPATNVMHTIPHEELTLTVPQGVGINRPLVITVGQQSSPTILVDYEAPVITGISPQTGPTAGGTTVTVVGQNFGLSGGLLTIGGVSAIISAQSPTEIIATTPAGVGTQSVQFGVGTQFSNTTISFTYGSPTITSISPPVAAVGSLITIHGENFGPSDSEVRINGVLCVNSAWFHTAVTVTVPPGVGANLPVTIRNTSSPAVGTGTFSYPLPIVNSVTPQTITGGQTITIQGLHFGTSGASVTIDGVACTSVLHTAGTTTLTAVAPIGVGVDRLLRVTAGMQPSAPYLVDYARPQVTSISPAIGPTDGGTSVTITGQMFGTAPGQVVIDGVSATVTTWSNTSIVAVTPAGTGIDHQVIVSVAGQTSTDQVLFDYAAPTIDTVTPTTVVPGQTITIDGANLGVSGATVTIDGVPAVPVAHTADHTQLTATVPMGIGTNKPVIVTVDGQVSNLKLIGYAAPTVSNFTPLILPTTGGTMTINGTGFGPGLPPSAVRLVPGTGTGVTTAVVCPVTSWSPTSIDVLVPAGIGANYDVSVVVGDITVTAAQKFAYAAPTVLSFTPNHAPPVGSTTMTITGTNFGPGVSVNATIGGIALGNISVIDHETITGTIPANVGADLPVAVNIAGRSATAVDTFDYDGPTMDPVTPNHGPTSGGTLITITGQNIVPQLGPTSVTIDGAACTIQNSGNGFIHALSPAGYGANRPVVVTIGGLSTTGTFSYDLPTLDVISLDHGPTQGGTVVTITGQNFGATAADVTLGGAACVVTDWQHQSITVQTPEGVGVDHPFVVDFPDQSRSVGMFDYDAPAITVPPAHLGAPGGGSTVTLVGQNFGASGASVTVDTIAATNVVHTIPHHEITFTVPTLANTEMIPVVVTVGGRPSAPILLSAAPPSITSISPTHLPTTGGNVTLTGDLFLPGTLTMTLDGAPFSNFTIVSPNQINVVVPPGVGTQKAIRVAIGGRSSNVVTFDYDAPRIDRFHFSFAGAGHADKLATAGGTGVFVLGANFGPSAPTITLGGIPMTVVHLGHNQIRFTAPPGFAADLPVVVTAGGQVSNIALLSYAPPTVHALSQESGSVDGGDVVTITGAHFGSSGTVRIGPKIASVSSWTPSEIVVTTPRQSGYALPVSIDNGVQTGTYRGFTYLAQIATNGSLALPSHDPVTFYPNAPMCAQAPHHPSLDLSGDFTFECQARIESWYDYAFFGKTTHVPNGTFSTESANIDGFTFFTRLGTKVGVILNGQTLVAETNTFFIDQQVHHFAVSRAGNTVSFFIDGTLIGQETFTAAIIPNTAPLVIGDTLPGFDLLNSIAQFKPFHGEMDEVRIWNVARTADEIRDFAAVALAGDEAGLVANWRFDEPSGQVILNSASATGAALDGFLGNLATQDVADPQRVTESPFPRLDAIPSIGAANLHQAQWLADDPYGLRINGIGNGASPGPFHVVWKKNEPLTLTWRGERMTPLLLLAGTRNPAALVTACPGIVDIGTAPTFSDVFILADGNSPYFPGPLFRLDDTGRAQQSFSYSNLPMGMIVNLQGIYQLSVGSPCPVRMTAAFYVTVAP